MLEGRTLVGEQFATMNSGEKRQMAIWRVVAVTVSKSSFWLLFPSLLRVGKEDEG